MVIVPKDKSSIGSLNSYYLNVPRLLEHYQGELGSGAIHFKSSSAEGVIFFDGDELLEGICENKDEKITGKLAIEFLMVSSSETNYMVTIYPMAPEKVYYWSSIPAAKRIYEDLSTEFTDLEGLLRKMGTEKLTGYIEVSLNKNRENSLVFFNNGQIVGGSYSWDKGELNGSKGNLDLLIEKTKKSGGTFHVSRISMVNGKDTAKPKDIEDRPSSEVITAMEELLHLFEGVVNSNKTTKDNFYTLLKKRFLELADTYEFLDPFCGEFAYTDGTVRFTGKAKDEAMMKGILTAVTGLAGELGLESQFQTKAAAWFQKHSAKLKSLGIDR